MKEVTLCLIIMPRASDPNFTAKKQVIQRVLGRSFTHVIWPTYSADSPVFDADEFRVELNSVDLVLADLSLERPSCYFELGFAECMDKNVLVIARKGEDIHQTSYRERIHWYRNLYELEEMLPDLVNSSKRSD